MTTGDVSRIHQRLDDIAAAVQEIAVDHTKTRGEVQQLIALIAKGEATRAATCPYAEDLMVIRGELRGIKVIGGIIVTALLVPGVQWFGSRIWELVMGGM